MRWICMTQERRGREKDPSDQISRLLLVYIPHPEGEGDSYQSPSYVILSGTLTRNTSLNGYATEENK